MNNEIRDGFLRGSGVDPSHMKFVLVTIVVAVALLFAMWVVNQLIQAYGSEQITSIEVFWAVLKLIVLLGLLFFVVL